ncbi:endonuclease MutS2 [Bacillus sp. B1-b2]|uniref:endonuclease MutS2 n=1 Tax=Bacillus sp. B1-b2 TaxID=2653201 RepID=UPI001262280C|nr:endonuclease MutS2 [Bacillus sp. B1-b2]KAB7670617.1 endonuclease MutS2 [Bacillus sp. B1-b2]
MNEQTFDVLGYNQILLEIEAFAKTGLGKETIRKLKPMQDKWRMEQSLKEVEEAIKILGISSSVPIHTLDEMLTSINQAKKGTYLRADQFTFVISFLEHCMKLKQFMRDKEFVAPHVASYVESIADVSELTAELSRCIRHGGLDDYASSDLSYLRRQLAITLEKVKEKANQLVKSKKYTAYLQDTNISERNGHLVISIKREYRSKIQGRVLDTSSSGATVFMEPLELADMQSDIEMMKLAEEHEVERILYELTEKLLEHEQVIHVAIETMHHYDVLFAKAKYSKLIDASIPSITEDYTMDLIDARHPLLGQKAVPLTIKFGEEHRALVITGPNTGGKTVTIKTIGLLTMLGQSGLPIPAKKGSKIANFQHIFVDIGDGQSMEQNLSTFSSRLVNIIDILKQTNDRSLVLLDELGSGTDPGEGMALAIVILEQLYEKGATLFATTHYSEMKEFADEAEGFLNGTMEFDLETLRPTYRLLLGQSGRSQAFEIANKLGLHPLLIEKAHRITYKTGKSYHGDQDLKELDFAQQIAVNKYARKNLNKLEKEKRSTFHQGDTIILTETKEIGIVYSGPDEKGNYIVQVQKEKRSVNHKRIQLYIKAAELYPENYDYDIVFKSKEYRKLHNQQKRKHIKDVWLEDSEN